MQESYLNNRTNKSKCFPPIKQKKKYVSLENQLSRLKQPDEKSLMLEIQDLDASLNNKQLAYHRGYLFSTEISDKLVSDLHSCLKKQSLISEDGFTLWNGSQQSQEGNNAKLKRLSNKLETFNQRMVDLSLKNVYEYDIIKYIQLMKNNKSRWSLFKRNQIGQHNQSAVKPSSQNQINSIPTSSNMSIKTTASKGNKNISHVSTLGPSETQINGLEKSILNSGKKQSQLKKRGESNNHGRKVMTQISEMDCPEETQNISKYEIKSMLKKEGEGFVVIWLPPATYPQFNGMFSYVSTRKLAICKLRKYFFFRRSLNERLFISILDFISGKQNRYIEGLELSTNKQDYINIYEQFGWKMKSIDGMNKIRIKFIRPEF